MGEASVIFKPKTKDTVIAETNAIIDDVILDILYYIYDNKFLQAVKSLKSLGVLGLKECKVVCDGIARSKSLDVWGESIYELKVDEEVAKDFLKKRIKEGIHYKFILADFQYLRELSNPRDFSEAKKLINILYMKYVTFSI